MDSLYIVALTAKRPVSAPKARPMSARVGAVVNPRQESLSDFVLLQGRLLAKAHANVIKPNTAPQPPRPQAPLDMLSMPSPSSSSPSTIRLPKEQKLDLTDSLETTGPLPLSITVVMRKRQEEKAKEVREVEISFTPDQTTTYNSAIMKEYQGLMKGVGCGLQSEAFHPVLPHPIHQKRPQGTAVEEFRRKRYSSTNRGATRPERRQVAPKYRFAKRALSGSFHPAATVFDPHDIYNVSNGTMRVT